MARLLKWLLFLAATAVVLVLGAALLLHRWVNSDDFRARAEREGSRALGVPLKVGRISVSLWPLPAVAADQVQVQSRPALSFERVEARPAWMRLLRGEMQLDTLVVRKAVLPQQAIGAIGWALNRRAEATRPPAGSRAALWPRKVILDKITFVDADGQRMTVDAQAQLAEDQVLESASVSVVEGRFARAAGTLRREAAGWVVQVDIGGGSVEGAFKVQPARSGMQVLEGQFKSDGVEVAQLTAPSRPLSGKLHGQTRLHAEFRDIAGLMDALRSESNFKVAEPVVAVDLAGAALSAVPHPGGVTRLDSLQGEVLTQGGALRVRKLVARAGALTATGEVAMAADRTLKGHLNVEVGGAKDRPGVPLSVAGTADAPRISLSREALALAGAGAVAAKGTLPVGGLRLRQP